MIERLELKQSGDPFLTPARLLAANQRAMLRVTRIAEELAKAAAPVRKGRLVRSITSRVQMQGTNVIGRVSTDRFQGRLIEKGVAPHDIVPRRRKLLRWRSSILITNNFTGRGRQQRFWAFAKRVHHPGLPARPFFEPAGERALADAPAIFNDEITRAAESG